VDIQDKLVYIATALSAERRIERLLDQILSCALEFSGAEAGSLYIVDEDDQYLEFLVVYNEKLNVRLAGKQEVEGAGMFAKIPLYQPDGSPNLGTLATYCAHTGDTINVANAYTDSNYDFRGVKAFDSRTRYKSLSFLSARMVHSGRTVGVLQLINARDGDGNIVPFSPDLDWLLQWPEGQVLPDEAGRLQRVQLEDLFESLIRMMNNALEAKSSHSGGHCQRVPELTMMIAHKAAEDARFSSDNGLDNENLYALRIAGLLHDCGKLVTPPHIMEKARKLENICDRIEQVHLRMELARKDWLLAAEGAEARAAVHARVNDDKAVLAQTNRGAERVSDEDLARVRDIAAQYRWLDADGQPQPCILPDELEALTIRAGTLTESEREEIKRHIVHTINMLESIPWPKHLRNVPELAGGHHERMDGKGYPRGLTREQMSLQARMMGIADIFEALTAADRPYKSGMTLSQAIAIMCKMRDNGHIDPDLFEVFVRERVYLRYGEQFLEAGQVDAVDVTAMGF